MNVLIVHAHYEPLSFTGALKDLAIKEFSAMGHTVEVSDLYAMNFDPVAKKTDFSEPRDKNYTVYSMEQRHGYATQTISPDIASELEKLLRADLLVFCFPIFWFSMPAILKGWIDRIFLSGVTYGGRNFYDQGHLRGKRALVTVTLGGREHMFGGGTIHGPFEHMLSHLLRGTLGYVGMDVLQPYIAWHVPYITTEARQEILNDYRSYLHNLDSVPALTMPSLSMFDSLMHPISSPGGPPTTA